MEFVHCGTILLRNKVCCDLSLYAVTVRTVPRIHFEDFAFVDKEGHAYFYASLEFCRLERVGSGIAFETRLGVNNLEFGLHGHLGEEDGLGGSIAHHFAYITLLHVVHTGDEVAFDNDIVPRFLVEEVILVAFGIGELGRTTLHAHILQGFADVDAAFQDAAAHYVLQRGTHDGVAFTGLNMEKVNAEVELAVKADASSLLDVL